jgi:heat shock protein HslJ
MTGAVGPLRPGGTRRAGLGLALAAATASCTPAPPNVDPLPPSLLGTSWRAETITGLAAAPGVASTLSFTAPDRVSGSSGCNHYGGPLTVREHELRLGPLIATRMACPPVRMEQERRFITALEQGRRFELDGDALLLRSAGRDGPTRFTRLAEPAGQPR